MLCDGLQDAFGRLAAHFAITIEKLSFR